MSEYIVDDQLVQGIISEAYRKGKGGAEVWTQREWRQEPIVRCKDCKWNKAALCGDSTSDCTFFGVQLTADDIERGFCAWGERVEGSE